MRLKMWLKKLGYEAELVEYLDMLAQTNDIKCLPKDVQAKYKFHDCIVYVDLTKELIDRWVTEITNTIDEIIEKEEKYEVEKMVDAESAEKIFFDTPEQVEKQSYYFATLCAYSPNLHKPYKLYLDKLASQKDEGNFFGGVGSNTKEKNDNGDEDMSWLNNL